MNIIYAFTTIIIVGLLMIGIPIGIILLIYSLTKKVIRYNANINQQKAKTFRAGIKKSDMPSYEDFKTKKLEEQKKS